MPDSLPQPTRSRPLERIVRHVSHRSRLRLETKNTATKRHVPSQRCYEAMRPWPAPDCAPRSNGEACKLQNKVMILRTLWRAHQETERPVAQASPACTEAPKRKEAETRAATCTKTKIKALAKPNA